MSFYHFWLSCIVFLFLSAVSYGDDFSTPSTNSGSQSLTFTFETKLASKVQKIATAKFSEEKNDVLLIFEATGLKKGKYILFKVEECKKIESTLKSKKKSEAEEIFSFETTYGEISSEKRFSEKTLNDLNLAHSSLGLVKSEKHKATLISCTHL